MNQGKKTPAVTNGNHSRSHADDPIAIIGIGCRFPEISNPVELWQTLMAGREVVGPYPGGRFAELDRLYEQAARHASGRLLTDRGGFLEDVTGFDAPFFEISPRESIYIDPQQRLLLEVAWEALEDAGQVRESYEGSRTGIYTGLWTSEYEARLYESATENDFYSITGCIRAAASGRLSFIFGMQGPSVTLDTACSSSMVTVHMACEALWAGEIDMALAGGANLVLGPEIPELLAGARLLSPDGRCKFGDASADGYVRSEGAGIVVLKRLSRAISDKDPIYALIRGTAVNNDGRSGGLLVRPSRETQREMVHAAWKSAGIDPKDLCYIEMHGTGTSVGDPVEIEAVGMALVDSGVIRPCPMGSIKTNIGHTETAAGIAGVIKAALVLRHRMAPRSLHFHTPSPKIAWDAFPLKIATEIVDFSREPGPLLVGANSFGITGTNAHIVLEEAPERTSERNSIGSRPRLLPISARCPEALDELLRAYRSRFQEAATARPEESLEDICYTLSVRRDHHEYRAAIVGSSLEELEDNLAAAIAHEEREGVLIGHASAAEHRVVFVAPGQGSQWLGMARELFDNDAVFRRAFERCDAAIAVETGWQLADRVLGPGAEQFLTHIDVIQPALFTMSVALAEVWRNWGIKPDAVVGHSMGEVAAAHIAGILTLEDAVAVICRRSRLMRTLSSGGSMATVELPLHEIEGILKSREGVSIGASNGPQTTVISGDSKAIETLLKEFEAKEVYCRQVKVDVASHSAHVDPILDDLLDALSGIRPQPAKIPMLSTVTGKYASGGNESGVIMEAAYWAANLRRTVLFAPAIQELAGSGGHATFVELSPHPILLPSIEASAREVDPQALAVPSLRRERPARATMLAGLAAFYAGGHKIAWNHLYSDEARCVRLPQYPFQRKRCWPEPGNPDGRAAHFSGRTSSLIGRKFESALQPNLLLWESELQLASVPYLNDHRVLRSAVFPASGHLAMAFSAVKSLFPDERYEIQNASFSSAAYIPDEGSKTFQLALLPEMEGRFSFEIRTRADEGEQAWPLRSKGALQRIDGGMISEAIAVEDLRQRLATHRSADQHYEQTSKCGLQYGPAFRLIQELWVGNRECLCRLQNCGPDPTGSIVHPAVLDACFQAILNVRPEIPEFQAADTYLPISIERIRIYSPVPEQGNLYATAILTAADAEKGTMRTDLRLTDATGCVLIEVTGMDVARVARENAAGAGDHLYSLAWVLDEPETRAIADRAAASVARFAKLAEENWIIFADDAGIADTMARSLSAAGGRCTFVQRGPAFMKVAADTFEIDPQSPGEVDRLLQELSRLHGLPTAIIHLWSLNGCLGEEYDAQRLINAQRMGSSSVPPIVQAISRANWENPPRLWLVTAGAMPAGDPVSGIRIESAPMWGMGRGVAREHAQLRASLVDLSQHPDDREARALAFEICANGEEDRVALRGDRKYVARIRPFDPEAAPVKEHPMAPGENYRLEISTTGIIDNIELREQAAPPPGLGEITVRVSEAGLNYNDVLKTMGLYPGLIPGQPIPLGNEAVGTVTAMGAGVDRFRVGDRVIALTPNMRTTGMMASSVTVPAILAVHKPANLTDEQAATMTIVYATAYWALIDQARIRAGEWILIHAGAGGVGLAAIEIAKWVGANVIATVSSEEKEDFVRSLGVHHVLNSRSLNFAAGVMEITKNRGVDIVLNSLAGEFLLKSLEVLAPYGRFVELGKRDVHGDSRVGLRVLRNNNSFHVVDVAAAVEDRQPYMAEMLAALMRRFESGEWKPLPVTPFSSADPSVPFRFMAQAKHIGKISIRMDRDVRVLPPASRTLFSAKASYLITGGLGGIALTLAEWMAKNGAGHLVLLSRRAVNDEAAAAIRSIQHSGARVTVVRGDVTREDDIANAMKTIRAIDLPLKGILHTAAVVDDALILDVTPERFVPVLHPKIAGAWNLHAATKGEALDFFVLFSSIAAIHPQPGMGSYAAANAFLDAFAHYLRGLGRPAISINWGGWDQIGLARAAGAERSFEGYAVQGLRVLSAEEALDALRRALECTPVQMVAIPIDAKQFAAFHGVNDIPPAFSDLVSQVKTNQPVRAEILDQLATAASPSQRTELLEAHLQETLGRVLKLASNRIDRDRALGSMGLDSLMGLEFVRRLSHSFEVTVPATVVFNYPTIRLLTGHLLQRMHLNDAAPPTTTEGRRSEIVGKREQSVSELADLLSEEDALQALMGNESRSS